MSFSGEWSDCYIIEKGLCDHVERVRRTSLWRKIQGAACTLHLSFFLFEHNAAPTALFHPFQVNILNAPFSKCWSYEACGVSNLLQVRLIHKDRIKIKSCVFNFEKNKSVLITKLKIGFYQPHCSVREELGKVFKSNNSNSWMCHIMNPLSFLKSELSAAAVHFISQALDQVQLCQWVHQHQGRLMSHPFSVQGPGLPACKEIG